MRGLEEHLPRQERLIHLLLFSLEGIFSMLISTERGGCQEDEARLYSLLPSNSTKGRSALTLPEEREEKNFFPVRVTQHWDKLSREAVDSPLLEIFKRHLDAF